MFVWEYGDRQVTVAGADVDVDAVCYGSCNACDFVPAVLSDVTFAVDMVDQTVADDGVFLAGGQWHSNPNAMTAPAAGETIWTITLALEPGQYEYKFQNGDGNYESVPAACGPGSFGNRVVDVGEEAVAVPLTKFGECPLVEGDGGTVTFHVDMQGQTVAEDGVFLGGGQWHDAPVAMTAPTEGGTVWSLSLALDAGDYMYKFQNGQGNYESLPEGAECAHGQWGDRMVSVVSDDIMLPPVMWGSCDPAPLEGGTVTFHVDMQGQTVAEDGVFLGGGQWHDAPVAMTAPAEGETIWSLSLELDPGDYMYKFQNGQGNYESLPEGAECAHGQWGDRMVTVAGDIMLPPVLFGQCSPALDVVTVTFHVDLGDIVSDGSVHLAGTMNEWTAAATPMSDEDGDNVWTVALDLNAGDTHEYKFVKDAGAGWEQIEGPCVGEGFGNRMLTVPSVNTELPAVCFNSCIGCSEHLVTFHVDMAEQTVAEDGVYLAGGIWHNDRRALHPPAEGETVWHLTLGLEPGEYMYKFQNGAGNYESLPGGAECAHGQWGDRMVVVADSDVSLPPVCFGSCLPCGGLPPVSATVTFHADMTELNAFGWDPSLYVLELRGGMNGWGAGDAFAPDLTDPNLYVLEKTIEASPDSEIMWKFHARPLDPEADAPFTNGGWEVGADHVLAFTGEDMMLDPMAPRIFITGAFANDVTFDLHVEWREGTLNSNTDLPFVAIPDTLIVNGDFGAGWGTWGSCMGPECATPTSPDVPRLTDPDGDMIYTLTEPWVLPAGSQNVLVWKMGAYYPGIENEGGDNGQMDNEAGFGEDRVNAFPPTTAGTIVLETVFGDNNPDNPWLVPLENELVNSGFEDGTTGWQVWPTNLDNFSASDMFAHMGTHSLKVLPRTDASDANPHTPIYQALSVADHGLMPGDWVHGDGHLMVDAAEMLMNDNTGYLFIEFLNGDYGSIQTYYSDKVDADSDPNMWHHMMVAGMVPPGAVHMNAGVSYYNGPEADAGALYADDVHLFLGPPPADGPVEVTFHVDMSQVSDLSDGPVRVAGTFTEWGSGAVEMTDPDGDGVYSVKIDLMPGDDHAYKFTYGANNDGGPLNWEQIEGPCIEGGFGDRQLHVDPVDMELPPVCYGECIKCSENLYTFHVDMGDTEIAAGGVLFGGGYFYPQEIAMHPVQDADGNPTSVFAATLVLEPGIYTYKYMNGPGGWETVPAECAVGAYGDREIDLSGTDMDMDIPPVCFGSCNACDFTPPVSATVTFHADMTELNAFGWDPSLHVLELRGGMNGWGAGDAFSADLTDPNLYVLEKTIEASPGSEIMWKFHAKMADPDADNPFSNGGWEVGGDHVLAFTGEDLMLDPMAPRIYITGAFASDVTIDLHVEWREGTLNSNTDLPFVAIPDTLIVNGDFGAGWGTWGSCMGPECATPTSPDVPRLTDPDGDMIYTLTEPWVLPAGTQNVLVWKMGAYYPGIENEGGDNGQMDNEAGFGEDRVNALPPTTTGTVVLEVLFGENNPDNTWLAADENELFIPQEFALLGNYPNPFNPVTTLRFDLDYTSDVTVTIYNINGNEIKTLQNSEMKAGRHSMRWNATNDFGQRVPSGLYLYKVVSDSRMLTGKMLLLK